MTSSTSSTVAWGSELLYNPSMDLIFSVVSSIEFALNLTLKTSENQLKQLDLGEQERQEDSLARGINGTSGDTQVSFLCQTSILCLRAPQPQMP